MNADKKMKQAFEFFYELNSPILEETKHLLTQMNGFYSKVSEGEEHFLSNF